MRALPAVAVLAVLLVGLPVAAQPVDRPIDLYRRAFEAYQAGDYAGSEALLRAALRLGDYDVLHLSLARALSRQGRCSEAADELQAAEGSPPAPSLGGEQVRARIEQYRTDLERECPGTLRVHCEPDEMRIRIAGRREESCRTSPVSLPPGEVVVRGRIGRRQVSRRVVVRAMREVVVELRLPAVPPPSPPPPPRSSAWPVAGWSSVFGGGVVLGAALVLDLAVVPSTIDSFRSSARQGDQQSAGLKREAELWQTATLVSYTVGAALAAAGAAMLLVESGEAH